MGAEVYTVTFVSEVGEKAEKQTITYDPVNGKVVEPNIKNSLKPRLTSMNSSVGISAIRNGISIISSRKT